MPTPEQPGKKSSAMDKTASTTPAQNSSTNHSLADGKSIIDKDASTKTATLEDVGGELVIKLDPGEICGGWLIERKLGEGMFGAVFLCRRSDGKQIQKYAMKVENFHEKINLLIQEMCVYKKIDENKHNYKTLHFPQMIDKGEDEVRKIRYIVMTLVGPSLLELKKSRPKCKFSMGTSLAIGLQTLDALSELHNIGYLHRDIKPANYAIGHSGEERNVVHMLDFGMVRRFVNDGGTLRRPRDGKIGFRGTLKYASFNAHLARELCRGDDIESWFYMLVECIKGKLPWNCFEDRVKILQFKRAIRNPTRAAAQDEQEEALLKRRWFLGGTPRQFVRMLESIAGIKYYDTPPYHELKKLLKESVEATKVKLAPLDWQKGIDAGSDEATKSQTQNKSGQKSQTSGSDEAKTSIQTQKKNGPKSQTSGSDEATKTSIQTPKTNGSKS